MSCRVHGTLSELHSVHSYYGYITYSTILSSHVHARRPTLTALYRIEFRARCKWWNDSHQTRRVQRRAASQSARRFISSAAPPRRAAAPRCAAPRRDAPRAAQRRAILLCIYTAPRGQLLATPVYRARLDSRAPRSVSD